MRLLKIPAGFQIRLVAMFLLMAFPVACRAAMSPPDESVPVILVTVGQEFEIRLPGNPGTGFTWAIEHLPRFLEQPGKDEYLPDRAAGSRIGAGGIYIWRFRANAAGEDEVRFVYRRSWEKDVPPARSAERRIVVKE
jgi:inhibitor of cysteine peptidase